MDRTKWFLELGADSFAYAQFVLTDEGVCGH